jgi:hypothetical protein
MLQNAIMLWLVLEHQELHQVAQFIHSPFRSTPAPNTTTIVKVITSSTTTPIKLRVGVWGVYCVWVYS